MFGFNDSRELNDFCRRRFLTQTSQGLGYAALSSLLGTQLLRASEDQAPAADVSNATAETKSKPGRHAKHIIYMHMVGGPSQMDLFEYKPVMNDWYDKDLPESIRNGQRLTTMTSGQDRFPIAPSKYKFQQYGECGAWVSELLPHTAKMVDELTFIRSMYTEAINHEPGITLLQTGNQIPGRPCMGSWLSYGLGSENENLPAFVVLVARPSNTEQLQAISARLWSNGYLPGKYAGVSFRSNGDPILFLNNPSGMPPEIRRTTLNAINQLNGQLANRWNDPQTTTRIQQFEMAFRMQTSVPELASIDKESASTLEMYGPEVSKPGSFANSALMARRLVERGVRFVQIYHNNWDTHSNVSGRLPMQCKDVDQPCWALIQDLKSRGMLEDTIVVWGGEFGRTIYSQGKLSHENYGRDHHPRCFTMWMAGGKLKPGFSLGATDDFSYNITESPVHIRDLHATLLHLVGIDHQKLTFKHQGLDQRLTGVLPARVIDEILV